MAYSFSYTENAKKDLEEIIEYIAVTLSNRKAAKDIFEHIIKEIGTICTFPEMYPEIKNRYIRISIRKACVDHYLIYYTVKDKNIVILRIIHSLRNQDDITGGIHI